MVERAVVAGVGMVPFTASNSSGAGMAERAVRIALDDAGLDPELVDQAVGSHVHGDPRSGDRSLARAGIAGIAMSNVSNGEASGSSALFHARQALLSGESECALAIGFEEATESFGCPFADRADPMERIRACVASSPRHHEPSGALPRLVRLAATQLEWMAVEMGIGEETFARVAVKSRAHAGPNPNAVHRDPVSIEQVRAAPVLAGRLRRLHISEPGCGAAAVILCTARFAARHGLRDDVVVAAHVLEGEDPGEVDGPNLLDALGRRTTRRVAERAYESAGLDPRDIEVAEVHDCCVSNELISCAALGLCTEDDIERFVASGANTYGGRVVVSPSGGLLSMGDAPGATGLAQICELTWQLRGEAGSRQVAGARSALQHNGGLGGPVAVAILQRRW